MGARSARTPGRLGCRIHHRRDHGEFRRPGRRPAAGARAGRLGFRQRGLTGRPAIQVFVGAERHEVIDLVLRYLGLGAPHRRRGGPAGPDRAPDALADGNAADQGRAGDRLPAGRQPALRCLRPDGAGDRRGPRARRVGARGRRLRSVGGGPPALPALVAGSRTPTRGRPMRTRPSTCHMTAARRSSGTRARCAPPSACTPATSCR